MRSRSGLWHARFHQMFHGVSYIEKTTAMNKHTPTKKIRKPTTDNNHHNNNSKVQTKTAAPLQHVLFLCLYKGVETNSAAPSLVFDPPRKQPANMYFHQ